MLTVGSYGSVVSEDSDGSNDDPMAGGRGAGLPEPVAEARRVAESNAFRSDGVSRLSALTGAARDLGAWCADTGFGTSNVPAGGASGKWTQGVGDVTTGLASESWVSVQHDGSFSAPAGRAPRAAGEPSSADINALVAALAHVPHLSLMREAHLEEALFDICPVPLTIVGSEDAVMELQAMIASSRGASLRGVLRRGRRG